MKRSLIGLVIGALALGLGAPGGAVQAQGSEVVADERCRHRRGADLAQAMALRTDLSLDASAATVKRAAEDAVGYPNMTWGVPLSDAEAAEIQRRIQVMESLLPAIHEAQKDPSWAGWQLDHAAGGMPVVYVAADAASRADALAKLAPPSTRVVVVEVERSLADLEALRDRLKASKLRPARSGHADHRPDDRRCEQPSHRRRGSIHAGARRPDLSGRGFRRRPGSGGGRRGSAYGLTRILIAPLARSLKVASASA